MADNPFTIPLRNPEAEKIVIGGLMLHPERILETAGKIKPDDFYSDKLRNLYAVMIDMMAKGESFDLPVLAQKAAPHGVDAVTVAECADRGIEYRSHEWAEAQTRTLRERREIQRELYGVCTNLGDIEYDPYKTMLALALRSEHEAIKIYSPEEGADLQFSEMERRSADRGNRVRGLRTGFGTLDYQTGGLCPCRMTVLIGPSGHGKTTTALNWVHKICVENKIPGLFISGEMRATDVYDRLVAIGSGEDLERIESGRTSPSIIDAISAINSGELHVSENLPMTVQQIVLTIQKYSIRYGIKVWVYDYLGLIQRDNPKMKEERDERFGRWVKMLRDISVRTQTHGILINQVNAQDRMAESKKIENDADHILHFSHVETEGRHVLHIRKNRFGPRGAKLQIDFNPINLQMREDGIVK